MEDKPILCDTCFMKTMPIACLYTKKYDKTKCKGYHHHDTEGDGKSMEEHREEVQIRMSPFRPVGPIRYK